MIAADCLGKIYWNSFISILDSPIKILTMLSKFISIFFLFSTIITDYSYSIYLTKSLFTLSISHREREREREKERERGFHNLLNEIIGYKSRTKHDTVMKITFIET